MAFTYSDANLGTATDAARLNSVRLLLGDTDSTDAQFQDAEVTFALSQTGSNIYYAAAWLARAASAKYSRQVNIELDGQLSAEYSDLAKQYRDLADQLEYQATKSGSVLGVAAGGITKTSVSAARSNTDRVHPTFRRDRFWNPPSYDSDPSGYEDS